MLLINYSCNSFFNFFKHGNYNNSWINYITSFIYYIFLSSTASRRRYGFITLSKFLQNGNYYFDFNWFNFLKLFWHKIRRRKKKLLEALNKLQEVIYKEYELESLGGQAAAASHSLGTPLATITVVAKELKKEIGDNNDLSKDIDLLISQSKRCGYSKKNFKKQIEEDKFFSSIKIRESIEEILDSFRETSAKEIILISDQDNNKIIYNDHMK